MAALDSKERKLLLRNDSNAIYAAPGYLLFVRDNTLVAGKHFLSPNSGLSVMPQIAQRGDR